MTRALLCFTWTSSTQSWLALNGDTLETLAPIVGLPALKSAAMCVGVAEALGYRADLSRVDSGFITAVRLAVRPATIESVTMGGETPRRGPRDTKAWAVWYKRGDVYKETVEVSVGSWTSNKSKVTREFTLGPSPLEQHMEALKALPPLKYFIELGKQLRAARKAAR
jgi:hypothetical protein